MGDLATTFTKYPPPWFSQLGSSKSSILAMETTRPKLYSYFRSSCSWRVRIALELAGVKVDQVAVHLVKGGGEQHAADYKKLNPMEQVPCSGIQPVQNLSVLQKHSADGKVGDAEKEWARHFITAGFVALEQLLKTTAGTCCVGNTVTMADCCLVPQVYNAHRFSVDMTAFPLITRLNSNLSERREFEAAHPSMQPDCPADLKLNMSLQGAMISKLFVTQVSLVCER